MSLWVWHYLHYFLVESKSCKKLLSLLEAHININQGFPNRGPWATFGLRGYFMWPAIGRVARPQELQHFQTFCIQQEYYFQKSKLSNFIKNFLYKFQVLTLWTATFFYSTIKNYFCYVAIIKQGSMGQVCSKEGVAEWGYKLMKSQVNTQL